MDPPSIDRTVGAYLAHQGLRQLAISETQKYGHVTYFYNGNRSGQFDASLERYVEIPSDVVEFNERPWMKAKEITDDTLSHIDAFSPHFIRVNYANGDMVGHTGDLEASITAMEVIDQHLPRLVNGIIARGGRCIITADHGNCEEMYEKDKKTGTFPEGHPWRLQIQNQPYLEPRALCHRGCWTGWGRLGSHGGRARYSQFGCDLT